ncbi:hypothetical protein BDZ85DRAFT_301818 [Elsinoe ampelina]|uniref:Oxidoreductase AflY n=1 Tax=Elsinoe ampelina TaxID=302913 RepID=A0A6A6G741_9PEZI|nr:hypothetical protein BDZ85DRAFT_301818 [Elsinoe ampelina]
MATISDIQLEISSPNDLIFAASNINSESVRVTSRLLTQNHEEHDIYFNDKGFHNHIVHHLITLLAIGASPEDIQVAYDNNSSYQRDRFPIHNQIIEDLSNEETFQSCLGKQENYSDYLTFFRQTLHADGIPETVNKYLFARTPLADDMLARFFGGVIHPLLHLGFALETSSLPLVAEALAMTAVHSAFLLPFFLATEQRATTITTPQPLLPLLHAARANPTFLNAAQQSTSLDLVDSILDHAWEPLISLASQYTLSSPPSPSPNPSFPSPPPNPVSPPSPLSSLPQALAEQYSTLTHLILTSQHPSLLKRPKLDFFLIHLLNASFFFPRFLSFPWLAETNKLRLLEWHARHAVLLYMGMRCPALHPEAVSREVYHPLKQHRTWDGVFEAVKTWPDDGHASKVVRALAHGERICGPYEGEGWCVVESGEWLRYAGVMVESLGGEEGDWVRFAGEEGAWERVLGREEWEGMGRRVGRRGNAEVAVERIEEMGEGRGRGEKGEGSMGK